MPELPEVQTIVDDLNKKIIGRRIIDVWFDAPKIITIIFADKRGLIRGTTRNFKKIFNDKIKGLKIADVKRRGKNILIYLAKTQNLTPKTYLLLIHQKLTGHLLCGKWQMANRKAISLIKGPLEEKVNNYIRLIFYLDNGWQLGLSDLRKFAKVLFGSKEEIEKLPDLVKIGPEPLDKSFKVGKFIETLRQAQGKRKIKQVLMDQEVIAGIGNIYSDEILWQAKIHPFKKANELTTNELKSLYAAMRQILKKAVKLRGTSTSDYRDTEGRSGVYAKVRYVYQREGEKCYRCQALIKRVKIGGRSSRFCPACQRLKP
ncbi:MAG: bifunctional DNA-formamidopyrimidine glycosylase/DNA-(apurinic or apyrimidinic site) lyase [bacterium]|nr:bifunctional DNA-formamidopyrimidine glycosylase/DNA-(apurinic or apyrimidinic site) lyase [bacterium]